MYFTSIPRLAIHELTLIINEPDGVLSEKTYAPPSTSINCMQRQVQTYLHNAAERGANTKARNHAMHTKSLIVNLSKCIISPTIYKSIIGLFSQYPINQFCSALLMITSAAILKYLNFMYVIVEQELSITSTPVYVIDIV